MLSLERVYPKPQSWADTLQQFPDHTVCMSLPWLSFVAETQNGEILIAALREGSVVVGYFSGVTIRRFSLRILGSPLPGWTTSYMGFVLKPEVPREYALEALRHFAFRDLRCSHMELMDRNLGSDAVRNDFAFENYNSFEVNLLQDDKDLLKGMRGECRRSIRKAGRSGVTIQQASDEGFVDDYYSQLRDVFAKQRLVPTYDKRRVSALIHHLLPTGNLLLLRALDAGGRCIATIISVGMHSRAEVWGSASWRADQHLRPNEALLWHTIRYWKGRSVQFFDLGGAGDYKRKYGGYAISVPWIRASRHPALPILRNCAALMASARQRWCGTWHSISGRTA
jgi:hypothetical protein